MTLLEVRNRIPALHPSGGWQVLDSDKRLLIIRRSFEGDSVCVLINVSDDQLLVREYQGRRDLLAGKVFDGDVEGYGVYFLQP